MSFPLLPVLLSACVLLASHAAGKPLNLVLITADDMNWDSAGCNGCTIPGITPNIDRLAAEGILFREAHATVPVCQPVRATMSTGLYPFHSGCRGFEPIRQDVKTFNEELHRAGYLISMMGKNPHYQPHAKWCVDFEVLAKDLMVGRSPERFGARTREFLEMAAKQGKPFFHHVNCQDPHRPFSWNGEGSGGEGVFPGVSRVIRPDEVEVPDFLENLPAVKQEVADYFTCVHRLDETVGAVMRELKAAGRDKDTLVMFFGGDHGMPFPFAKANVYQASSRGTLILRWPGAVEPGKIDTEHLVSTIDFAPTLLEAAGLPELPGIDGRSFLPIAKGGRQDGRDAVFTMFHMTSGDRSLEMRCIATRRSSYIWNAWSDGDYKYQAENMAGRSWRAMLDEAAKNPAMKERCDFYLHRSPEEYHHLGGDASQRGNKIADPACAGEVKEMQQRLAEWMDKQGDPLREAFAKRHDKEFMRQFNQGLRKRSKR